AERRGVPDRAELRVHQAVGEQHAGEGQSGHDRQQPPWTQEREEGRLQPWAPAAGAVGSLPLPRGVAAAACGSPAPVDSAPTSPRRSSGAAGSPVSGGLVDGLAESVGGAAGGPPPGRLGVVTGVPAGGFCPVRRSSDAGGDGAAPDGALPDARGTGATTGAWTGPDGRGCGSAAGPSSDGGRCFGLG